MTNMEWIAELKRIAAIHRVPGGKGAEVLVELDGLKEFEATWESTDKIREQYPTSTLRTRWLIYRGILISLECS